MVFSTLFRLKMKFAWKEYYFSYNSFKKLLRILKNLDSTEIPETKIYEYYCSEVEKISLFFSAMMLDIEKDWKNIQYNLIFYEKEKNT